MGAWGVGTFENDDAVDWIAALVAKAKFDVLERTLRRVATLKQSEYLDARLASESLVATEVVAALKGRPSTYAPIELIEWSRARFASANIESLTMLGIQALRRIKRASELRDLHEEVQSVSTWNTVLDDLETRLS